MFLNLKIYVRIQKNILNETDPQKIKKTRPLQYTTIKIFD